MDARTRARHNKSLSVECVLQLKADTEAAAALIRGENERRAAERLQEEAEHEAEKDQLTAKGLNPYKVGPGTWWQEGRAARVYLHTRPGSRRPSFYRDHYFGGRWNLFFGPVVMLRPRSYCRGLSLFLRRRRDQLVLK